METQVNLTSRPQEAQELRVPEEFLANGLSRLCSLVQTPKLLIGNS